MKHEDISPLVLQLLQWIAARPRTYEETMDAWRSTCPRLTTWEDALTGGLVQIEADGDATRDLKVTLTVRGRSLVESRRAASSSESAL